MVGRNKKTAFNYIKERICHRLRDWNKRALSRAGKEVLLKSIIQAILSYVMSVFLLAVTFCEDVERRTNAFWWGRNQTKQGMGFPKIRRFNLTR